METLTKTLSERVNRLIVGKKRLPSTTPKSVMIDELLARTEALEKAVREIALEVEKLSRRVP